MLNDLYVEILDILNLDLPKEETANKIKKLVDVEVIEGFMEILKNYKEKYCN